MKKSQMLRHAGAGGVARVKGTRDVGALGDAKAEKEGVEKGAKRDEEGEAPDEGNDNAGSEDIIGVDAGWRRREGRRA